MRYLDISQICKFLSKILLRFQPNYYTTYFNTKDINKANSYYLSSKNQGF